MTAMLITSVGLWFFCFLPPARHREPLRRGGRVSAESKKKITLCELCASSEAGGKNIKHLR
jgi:hypothetical protein